MVFDEKYGSRFIRALGFVNFVTQLSEFGGTHALIIERYDRDTTSPGGRIDQEDLAQALCVPTIEKYQNYGAATLERVSRLLAETGELRPNVTLAKTLTLSVALRNLDMHAKTTHCYMPKVARTRSLRCTTWCLKPNTTRMVSSRSVSTARVRVVR